MKYAETILIAICAIVSSNAIAGFIVAPDRFDIAYDKTRKVLYISGDDTLRRYDMEAATLLAPIALGGKTAGMDISPDGKTLAVANTVPSSSQNHVDIIDLASGASSRVNFDLAFGESGTYTAAYDSYGDLLVSSRYSGSGWTPLRKYDAVSGTTTELGHVRQDSMLSASADRRVIGVAESNISDGRWGVYASGDSSYDSQHKWYDPVTGGTGWFNFEIGVSRDGSQIAIPTYGGTFVGDASALTETIGTYAGVSPIGVAYSTFADIVYMPMATTNYIAAFDTATLAEIGRITVPGNFGWTGNHAFVEGRSKVADRYLFTTLDNGIFFTEVPIPPASWLLTAGLIGMARRTTRSA